MMSLVAIGMLLILNCLYILSYMTFGLPGQDSYNLSSKYKNAIVDKTF